MQRPDGESEHPPAVPHRDLVPFGLGLYCADCGTVVGGCSNPPPPPKNEPPADEEGYGLLYPFVVCASKGGPYDDGAFVAGCWFGQVSTECKGIALGHEKSWYVPSALVPQIDLLAMHEGLTIAAEPWGDYPDEWTQVTLSRGAESGSTGGFPVSALLAAPPLVSGLLAHPGSNADVAPRRTLRAGHADPTVEARRLGPDGGDALRDLVEGVLLVLGGYGGNGSSSSEGFDGYVGDVHASTMPDGAPSRQEVLTDQFGRSEQ